MNTKTPDQEAADLIVLYAEDGRLRRPHVKRDSAGLGWRVWLPPTHRNHFDVDGWTHIGPYGDTFWPTWGEAYTFVLHVLSHCPHCGSDVRTEPDAGRYLVCNGCCELLSPHELVGATEGSCTELTGHLPGSDHRWQQCPTYTEEN